MAAPIQFRRDSVAVWMSTNPVLAAGEPGLESDTGRIKFGDGTTPWNTLAYFLGNVDDTSDVAKPVSSAQAGAIAARQPLDSDLAAIAALSPADGDLLQRKAGEWSNRTPAQVKTDLALTSADVGLSLVDNTADVLKPVSLAQTALVFQAIGDHRIDPGAHAQYVPYSVYTAAVANLQAQIDALTGTAPPASAPPDIVTPPVITGSPVVGSTLACSTGTWTNAPSSYGYQWFRDGVVIPGATASTYQTGPSDFGPVSCMVIATNAIGGTGITSAPVTIVAAQTSSPSNPVTPAMSGLRTFDVGPGQPYSEPDTVPWGSLVAGDVVNIHHRPAPYAWKIGLRGQGTQANPIVVNGVTDASGNRPVFDFTGSRTASGSNPGGADNVFTNVPEYGESLGGIVIKRGPNDNYYTYKPQWIEIRNLEVRGASNGAPYTTLDGGLAAFGAAGGIYVHVGQDILIDNCVSTDNSFGIFTQAKDDLLSQATERLTVRNCRVFGNGIVSSWFEHNFYIQCANPIVEGNFIGQTRPGSFGSSYKSRSSGEIFRYNYVEASARACDWVHAEEQSGGIGAQADYGTDYVYGNVFVNDFSLPNGGAYEPLHYGGDNQGEQEPGQPLFSPALPYRTQLYFFNNTVINRDAAGLQFRMIVFGVSIVPGTIDAWNNIFVCSGPANFSWLEYAGTLNLRGMNLVFGAIATARAEATAGHCAVNQLGGLMTADPLLLSPDAYDYAIQGGSPAIDASLTPVDVPGSVLSAHPVLYQPRMRSNGLSPRAVLGSALELGAIEFDPGAIATTPPVNITPPEIPGNLAVGQTLACSTGTWSGSPTSYAYQWMRAGSAIGGATSSTYTLVDADAASDITVIVTAANAAGSTPATSNVLYVAGPSADPDAGGTFNFSAPNGTPLAALSNKFVPAGYADNFECQAGALRCVTGTGYYGGVVHYENGQGVTQQSTLVRTGAPFPSGGELGVYVQTNGVQGGYGAWFAETNVQLRRHAPADVGPVYIDQGPHGITWTGDATLRIEFDGGVVRVFANGIERLSYADGAPLSGGFPGLYMVPGANVSDHAVTAWTDQ